MNSKEYCEKLEKDNKKLRDLIKNLTRVGIALSSEHDLHTLLREIVAKARLLTKSEGGSLYIKEDNCLSFEIFQNDALESRTQTLPSKSRKIPIDNKSIAGYVALTGQIIHIDNVDDAGENLPFSLQTVRELDAELNYKTVSMLAMPMKNNEDMIGVLQLLNSLAPEGNPVPYDHEIQEVIVSLASQAAIAISNSRLYTEMEVQVFERTKELLQRTRELEMKKDELQKLNATKDRFFSIIAHDLRNPFTVLLGYIDLLTDHYNVVDEQRKSKYLQNIKSSSESIYKLLENLLQWARLNTGSIEYSPKIIDLHSVIAANISFLQNHAENKCIRVNAYVEENLSAFGDVNMITFVIRNLVSNAIKFTNKFGEVNVYAKEKAEGVEIIVSDNGVGICEDDIPKLFNIDVPHTTKGTFEETGTGLGLIICKEFIEKHSGTFLVESQLGEGSKFTFRIPGPGGP